MPKACNFIKRETLAQLFSYEFCEISKNTFFAELLRWLLSTNSRLKGFLTRILTMFKFHRDHIGKN